MAKIYETKEDVERERLAHVVKDAQAQIVSESGVTGIGLSLVLLGLLRKKPAEIANPKIAGFLQGAWDGLTNPDLRFLGGILALMGGMGIYSGTQKSNQAKAELAKLGPEQIMLPESLKPIEGEHVTRLQNTAPPSERSL
jgi:hypothetical protein